MELLLLDKTTLFFDQTYKRLFLLNIKMTQKIIGLALIMVIHDIKFALFQYTFILASSNTLPASGMVVMR